MTELERLESKLKELQNNRYDCVLSIRSVIICWNCREIELIHKMIKEIKK